jgi:hypothetical protein
MKSALAILLGTVAGSALAGIPEVPQYKFSFVVQSESEPLVRIDAALPLGTNQVFQATRHLRIEVQVPASTDDQSHTIVRLVDDSTGHPVYLHSATTGGSIASPRQFAYLVCSQRATFYSGLPSAIPTCGSK